MLLSGHSRKIAAAVAGNALEWYDFVVFGFLATILSQLFFPAHDAQASLLLTLATFGAGFVTRPLGGVFFGFHADRRGRKASLHLVILLMTLAIAVMAFAPTYERIGLGAPLLMVVGRLMQGFATGGEFASATSFLVEAAPAHRRGFYGSLQMAGQGLAVMMGTAAGILLTRLFSPAQILDGAWRLPFVFGLLIGPVGFYIRRHLEETPAFETAPHARGGGQIFRLLLRDYPGRLAASFGATICATIYFYVILVYMPTYAKTELRLTLEEAFVAQACGLAVLILLTPLVGALSDRFGRRPFLFGANILFALCALPLFSWIQTAPTVDAFAVLQMLLCAMLSGVLGVFSTVLAEQFPTGVRSSGLAITYNIAVMIFGGFAPFVVSWLISYFATPVAPAYYVIFGALAGISAAFFLEERRADALH